MFLPASSSWNPDLFYPGIFLDLLDLRLHDRTQLGEFLLFDLQRSHTKVDQNTENNNTKAKILNSYGFQNLVDCIHDPSHYNCNLTNDRGTTLSSQNHTFQFSSSSWIIL
ncbi:hypothetical protein RUMOBE_02372 [Blautia obeum ATCC 29174]|uniref:Uncharacterized protein n=1 Tax=Blautia obeum ATCC 29174 TaxID=411459 RepID=A5ZTP4_9FIRM|nr:hypothetical protein RUMOBE_02372 [Blautia obeum ATCC 29174]